MIIHQYAVEKLADLFGIQIGSIEGLESPAGWGRVKPGERSTSHQHDETECFVIVEGTGELTVDGKIYSVSKGDVAVFEPFESHVITNTDTTDLVFFLQYRRNNQRAEQSATNSVRQTPSDRPQFVFSTPPTPNGDLHLGHLSGPYLGADVYVRYQRLIGNKAWHLTGSDDYQSYVVALANREGKSPQDVAAWYSKEIAATLKLMDIEVHQYTVTDNAPGYKTGLQDFFSRVVASGNVLPKALPALRDAITQQYLYEVDVSGVCPGCSNSTNGNICEECGEPNLVYDMGNALSKISNTPAERYDAIRYVLPLDQLSENIEKHHAIGRVPARLRELAARVFSRKDLDIPITHYSAWGIPPAEQGFEDQVIWVWPEMSYGFLHGIQVLGETLDQPWRASAPQKDWKIVHFFGYDNSFYHSILYPALYQMAWPEWQPDIDYHVNEFYLLEGKKFSTSRRHAIWGKDILNEQSVDSIRYYLCLTRPEDERTNFQLDDYEFTVRSDLIENWQAWLNDLGSRVNSNYQAVAPDAGIWTSEQVAFLATLNEHLRTVTLALNSEGFSLQKSARQLSRLVHDTLAFSHTQRHLAGLEKWRDEYRTSIALELAAAYLLASISAPLMPRFAKKLALALGSSSHEVWPNHVSLVTPGALIRLDTAVFFVDPAAPISSIAQAWLEGHLRTLLNIEDGQPLGVGTLQELGASSLVAVTLQYHILSTTSLDVPLNRLLNSAVHELALELDQGFFNNSDYAGVVA